MADDEKQRPKRRQRKEKKEEKRVDLVVAGDDDDDAFRAAFRLWTTAPDLSLRQHFCNNSGRPLVVGVVLETSDRAYKVDLRYCGRMSGGGSRDVLLVECDGRRKKILGVAKTSDAAATCLSIPTSAIVDPRTQNLQAWPRTSEKIFASEHGPWETLELAEILAKVRLANQTFFSKNAKGLIAAQTISSSDRKKDPDIVAAELKLEQFFLFRSNKFEDSSNDAIAATIAQLVALGICDRGYRQIARFAHAMIADRLFRATIGMTEFGLLESMFAGGGKISDDAAEKNAMSFRAPFFLCDGRADAYVYDRSRDDFCCMSDGRRIAPAKFANSANFLPEANLYDILQATRRCAKHRNGVAHKESVVFAMPYEYGFARDSFPCLACGENAQNFELPKCSRTKPVALRKNFAHSLITASDIKMVACLVAARRYDEMVRGGCVETDAACVATLCASENLKWRPASEAIAAIAARAVEAKVKASSASARTAESILRAVERDAADAARAVSLGEAAVEAKYGLWVEDAFCDERTFAAAARLRKMLDVSKPECDKRIIDVLRKKFGAAADADLRRKLEALARGGNFTLGGADAVQNLKKQQLLPGAAELAAADWDLCALRQWVPPCIARILDECNVDRHPKYDERTLVGSFMCRIDGLAERFDRFYAAWASMFQHPEKSSELYGNPGKLDSSKYGHAAAEDAINCAGRGVSRGCPHAIKTKLCPFALEDVEEMHAVLRKIEERRRESLHLLSVSGKGADDAELPKNISTADRCKTMCARYLCATLGNQNTRIVMVSSPAWFYKIARGKI